MDNKDVKNAANEMQAMLSATIKPYEETISTIAKNIGAYSLQMQKNIIPVYTAIKAMLDDMEPLLMRIGAVAKRACVVKHLGRQQYVQWEFMADEFVDEILRSKDINETLSMMYEKERYQTFYKIVEECLNNDLTDENKRILTQSANAFRAGDTDLAAIGIAVVIDGALSQIPGTEPKITSIKMRAAKLSKKLEKDELLDSDEIVLLALLISYKETFKSIGANSDFAEKEPENINRHWLLHGRSNSLKTKLDCVKLVRFLYATIIINKMTFEEKVSQETGEPLIDVKGSGGSVNSAVNAMQMLQKEMACEAEKVGLSSEADINEMVKEIRDGGA